MVKHPMASLFILLICSALTHLWIFLRSAARGLTRHRLWVAAPDRRSHTEEGEQVGRGGWGKDKKRKRTEDENVIPGITDMILFFQCFVC